MSDYNEWYPTSQRLLFQSDMAHIDELREKYT